MFDSNVMDALVVNDLDRQSGTQFVTEFDAIPGFWNYLGSLDRTDLIAELIQNDLDQDATRTVISFGRTCLVCSGNGKPVEPDGWKRLRKIMGAGDEVPAKRSRFGVKNHGLKTAFTIGDEIRLLSAGQSIVQTLYSKGRNMPPHPGASDHPMEDRQAPPDGCRVIVHYRDADLEPSQGEAIKLNVVGVEEIDALFQSACVSTAEQFAGIVSPEITPRHEIVLRHWRLGEVRFFFSCTRPRKIAKRIELFQRRCTVSGTFSPRPVDLREQSVRRLAPLKGVLKDRVADFFRRGRRFFVEASWPIDAKGKPKTGTGKFRYPIGYPPNSHEARTGHSTYFHAPFVSDTKRHAPARHEATYRGLCEACESLLIDALAHHTIPRWGADGLKPVVPSSNVDDGDKAVRPLLVELAKRGALPVLNWSQAAELAVKGKKDSVKAVARQSAVRRSSKKARRYRFVVPALTWAQDVVHPLLALLCPRSEMQLHPRAHTDIIRLLADGDTTGFAEDFVTFDQNDVFDRVTANGNQRFDAVADPEREFTEPFIAHVYLDLIKLALDEGRLETQKEDTLVSALLLPNTHGQATSFVDICASASLPSDIPGLQLPPILDPALVSHALFRRRKWQLQKFTMADFLKGGFLQSADEETRRQFWQWLCRNERSVARKDRPKLADLAIWPDEEGRLCRISDLCDPRMRHVGTALADSIRRPHEQVSRSRLVSVGGKARTSIRRTPTEDELARWFGTRTATFEIGSTAKGATIDELRRFEADLVLLLKDATIARQLRLAEVSLPALAQDGSIQPRIALVMPSRNNDRLALPSRFLLRDRDREAWLNKLSPPLSAPTAEMLLNAFVDDPNNFDVLHPRLKHFLSVTEPDDSERIQLAKMPVVPVRGQPCAPSELAFRGNKGDYWGAWKTCISGEGLSQADQRRYREAGVMSAVPDAATSRAFFAWLSDQDRAIVEQHMPCVLRQILHRAGPTDWAKIFTDTPFIPVRGQDGLRLVSLRTARRRPVYLSDAGEIGEVVIRNDRDVLLVVDHVQEVTEPVSEPLRDLRVRSLREAIKEPKSVSGTGNVVAVREEIIARLRDLQSLAFRQTFRKRLNELDVESDLLRHDWHSRLARVQEIHLADQVKARYQFRGRSYTHDVEAGFNFECGILYVKRDRGIRLSSLYESLAKQLIFKPAARRIDLFALEHAVGLEIEDPSFGRPSNSGTSVNHDDNGAEEGRREEHAVDSEPGEALEGHSPFEPNPAANSPKPRPLQTESAGRSRRSSRNGGTPDSSGDDEGPRQTPQLERKHRDALKRDHYASHCQMCLCERPPQELAPTGSYVEWEEVRRHIVEAHHPDLVSGGGARHAGNMILLCKFHHNNYGQQLSRARVTAALRGNPKEQAISFGQDTEVRGRQIELEISGKGEIIKLFFTDHHIEYWLSQEETSDRIQD